MPSTFTLKIQLGNDAMRDSDDVAEALRDVAAILYTRQTDGAIRDKNGNTVGRFHTTHPDN